LTKRPWEKGLWELREGLLVSIGNKTPSLQSSKWGGEGGGQASRCKIRRKELVIGQERLKAVRKKMGGNAFKESPARCCTESAETRAKLLRAFREGKAGNEPARRRRTQSGAGKTLRLEREPDSLGYDGARSGREKRKTRI